jgi:quercetin dioxygenase-like cupin family protein
MRTSILSRGSRGVLLAVIAPFAAGAESAGSAPDASQHYTYATNGITDHIGGGSGAEWKLLLNESNLGGKELQMVEVTLAPGTTVQSHTHGALEVVYVLGAGRRGRACTQKREGHSRGSGAGGQIAAIQTRVPMILGCERPDCGRHFR